MVSKPQQNPLATLIGVIIVGVALFSIYLLPGIIAWWNQYGSIVIMTLMIILVVVGVSIFVWWIHKIRTNRIKKARENEERLRNEEEYRKKVEEYKRKGWTSFRDRNGVERWETPNTIKMMQKEDEELKKRESLFGRIVKEIEDFEPAREKLKQEYSYQLNLHGWLKRSFPSATIEKLRGSSKPDIIIDDIAIEIKGPTDRKELDTIASKVMRYSQNFEGLIIVLFELKVSSNYYEEWKEGMKKTFTSKADNIKVITK